MKYEQIGTNLAGEAIFGRIDEDGVCRFTCTEDNPEYQAYLNPDKVEHLTEIVPANE
jgi:hypothetical protein